MEVISIAEEKMFGAVKKIKNPPQRHRGTEISQRKSLKAGRFSLCFLCVSVPLWWN
jgi:hypothetical protein